MAGGGHLRDNIQGGYVITKIFGNDSSENYFWIYSTKVSYKLSFESIGNVLLKKI